MSTVLCSLSWCRRRTKDPSGRCHNHRGASTSPAAAPYPALVFSAPGEPEYSITFRPDGGPKQFERWKVEGRYSREDGPALIRWHRNGRLWMNHYYRDGREHRIDGPAEQDYDPDGVLTAEIFFFHGARVDGYSGLAAELSRMNNRELRTELRRSPYGVLLEEGVEPREIVRAIGAGIRTPEGVREMLAGAPVEWVRSFEESQGSGALPSVS